MSTTPTPTPAPASSFASCGSTSSSPPSTSAVTLDTSSLFIPRRRPPPPTTLRAPLHARNATGKTSASAYSSLRSLSASGAGTTMNTNTSGKGKLYEGSEVEQGEADAIAHLQSEMGGVSLHPYSHGPAVALSASGSSHELAVDIKRRLFNDAPRRDQGQLAQSSWHPSSSSSSPEDRHEHTASPVRRISQTQAQAHTRESPPRGGILTRSKVSRAGSVRISEAPQRRRSSTAGPYHDGSLSGKGHGYGYGMGVTNGTEIERGGAAASQRGSPRCTPLRTRGRGRAATPYPGESSQDQGQPEVFQATASHSSSSPYPPLPTAQEESPFPSQQSLQQGTSPLSPHSLSLSSSYPSTSNTRPSTSTSTSTILLSHAESSSLQRAHFLSEKAQQEERELLRGLEMCTGLGRRLGVWEGMGQGQGQGQGQGEEVSEEMRVGKRRAGGRGRDRWVLSAAARDGDGDGEDDGDEDLQYWHPQEGEADGGGAGDVDYAHEQEEDGDEDDDLFGGVDGGDGGDGDELFDLDDDRDELLDDDVHDASEAGTGGSRARGGLGGKSRGLAVNVRSREMDALHESFEEEEDEGDEEEEEEWSR